MSYLVVVGSLNMDLVVQVPEIPKPGETVLGRDFATYPGGKGANQAVAAARLGASVRMVGQVGKDSYADALLENLANEDVNSESVFRDYKSATGVAMITVDARGQNSIAVASGANFTLTTDQIQQAWGKIEEVDVLIMPLETPPATILEAARLAKDRQAKVVLNPAPARPLTEDLLSLVDVLVPNEHEIFQISDQINQNGNQVESAARMLISQGVGSVVTTLGGEGVSIIEADQKEVRIPSYPVDVIDTTAAGDSFVAALAVGLADGKSIKDACLYANAVGALTVTKMGAQPSLPTHSEVSDFLDQQELE